jgi:hypothetical protein
MCFSHPRFTVITGPDQLEPPTPRCVFLLHYYQLWRNVLQLLIHINRTITVELANKLKFKSLYTRSLSVFLVIASSWILLFRSILSFLHHDHFSNSIKTT